jgi:hypothetical protein
VPREVEGKRYLRISDLAERYQTTPRTIERMSRDGRLPRPDLYLGRFPLWDPIKVAKTERETMVKRTRGQS